MTVAGAPSIREDEQGAGARLSGLDSVRFLCALIVVFAHTGQPPLRDAVARTRLDNGLLDGLVGNIWSSAAAVIVFFVISGFCIHYPNARRQAIRSLPEYYTRRYVRILIPAIVAIGLSVPLGLRLSLFQDTILWSVAAELIYYTIYPALLALRRRLPSWLPVVGVSFLLGLAVAATQPGVAEYPKFGLSLNWLLGLPCWILGCWLADLFSRGRLAFAARFVWLLRAAAWGAMIACSVLRYHSPIGYPWTLNVFAFVVMAWLGCELAADQTRPAPRALEWAGRWSYSLYLTHKLAAILIGWLALPPLGGWLDWAMRLSLVLAFAYVFYLLCEKPAHLVAKWAGRRWKGRVRPAPELATRADESIAGSLAGSGGRERPAA